MEDAQSIADIVMEFSELNEFKEYTDYAIARVLHSRGATLDEIITSLKFTASSWNIKALALFEGAEASYSDIAACFTHAQKTPFEIVEALEHIEKKHPSGKDSSVNYSRIAKAMYYFLNLSTYALAEVMHLGSSSIDLFQLIVALKTVEDKPEKIILAAKKVNYGYANILLEYSKTGTHNSTLLKAIKKIKRSTDANAAVIVSPIYQNDYAQLAYDMREHLGSDYGIIADALQRSGASIKENAKSLYSLGASPEEVVSALRSATDTTYNNIAAMLRYDLHKSYCEIAGAMKDVSPQSLVTALSYAGCKRVCTVLRSAGIPIPENIDDFLSVAQLAAKSPEAEKDAAVRNLSEMINSQHNHFSCAD